MVQHYDTRFTSSFAALADATRRGVLDHLGSGDASITDLAVRFEMSLTGMKKHVGVLELAGLVTTEKVGRVRTCTIGPSRLEEEMEWILRYRELWDARFDALDRVLVELKAKEKFDED
ncbi:MAG: metalloregulator ArsR/SmtB family transcription factor [Pseudolysinimonas sp.]